MKIAVFADIQGNAFALEAALNDLQRHQPDLSICLGDVATGPEPVRCLHLLQAINCQVVQGNMDAAVLNLQPYHGDDSDEQRYNEMDQWCAAQLSESDRRYIASFRPQIELETPFGRLLCVHGSPVSYDDVIEATTPDTQLTHLLGDHRPDVLAVGHMHTPMLRTFEEMTIFNPGSIGLPYGAHRPMPYQAQYVILQEGDIHFHSVHYDAALFRQRLLAGGMPHSAWFASKWQG